MPFAQSLQGSPPWFSEAAQELVQKSRQLGNEPYVSYGQVSPEKSQYIRNEIERLIKSQKGNKFDIIPFSITRASKPINLNSYDLKHIAENEGFARRIYESATGYHNVSRDELEDLRQRARHQYEFSLPEIMRLESQRQPLAAAEEIRQLPEPQYRNIAAEKPKIELQNRENTYLKNLKKIDSERLRLEKQFSNFVSAKKMHESSLRDMESGKKPSIISKEKLKDEIERLEKGINLLQTDIIKLSAERNPLEKEIMRLESQRQPSAAAEEIRQLPEPQYRNIAASRENIPSEMSNPEDVIKRASIEREINRLHGEQGRSRIAPMNETSQRAISMLERSFNDDTMELAANELKEAKKHSELEAVGPLVRSSIEDPSDKYMNKYIDDYTKDIRKSLEDESEKEFLEKIAPKINMSFTQMGAFHSGARAKALNKALSEHREKLRHETAKLTSHARDKGMEQHELKKRREQSAAHLIGHTTKSEKEASQRHSELLRQHAVSKHGLSHLNAAALGQVGEAEQKQRQHEIDAERQEFERHRLYREEQLAKQAALLSGLPQPSSQTTNVQFGPSPQPPNLFTTGAGLTAALASGFSPQQQRQFKKGGSVRKKYADGGAIGSDEIGNEIRNIIKEQGQAGKTHLEEASNYNPIQGWLRHVGKEMLTNPHEDPLLSLGRGTSNALDHRDIMRERAANLYDKIQATKLNQYQVLAAYENMKDKREFQREQLSELSNFHQQKLNLSQRQLDMHQNSGMREYKKTSQEKKMEDKALENIIENHEMKNDLVLMENAIKGSTLGTGPWIGVGKSFLGIDNDIDVLGNHIVTKANKLYGRGAGSNLQLKTLQGGKPGQNLSKKANETIIKKYGQESDRKIQKNIAFLLKSGWSPEEISAATGMQMSNNSLIEEEPQINEEEKSSNSIINMIDPNGNPLEVPSDQVKQALKLGAVLAK